MPTADAIDPLRLEPAYRFMRDQTRTRAIPGAVLAVADPSGIVRCEAAGRESGGDKVTPESLFWIASITKPIFATAVLQLVERGLLALDEPVARHLPEFAPPSAPGGGPGGESVTPWHLLTHTAGLTDAGREVLERQRPDRQALYRLMCTRPLLFPPGSSYAYASDSFYVLGELIRRLTSTDYPEYLRQGIFEVLGMRHTGFDPRQLDGRPAPVRGLGLPRLLGPVAVRYVAALAQPGGGLWSNAADLVRFGLAMLGGGRLGDRAVLAPSLVELMTSEQTAGIAPSADPPGIGARADAAGAVKYGLGWAVAGPDPTRTPATASPRSFGHGGATGGYIWIDPAHELVIVFLMNRWADESGAALRAIDAVYAALEQPAD